MGTLSDHVVPHHRATATPDVSGWWAGLEAIPGIDINSGFARDCARPELIPRMLRLFVNIHTIDMARLSQAMASGDLATLGTIARYLKTSAEMIGARRVSAAGAALRSAIEAGGGDLDAVKGSHDVLVAELTSLIEAIRGELDKGDAKPLSKSIHEMRSARTSGA